MLGQREAPQAQRVGDETRALSGPVDGGEDITFYVRSGPLLLRISATSATNSGLSMASPEQIARAILEPTSTPGQTVELAQPADALPVALPLADAANFRVEGEGAVDGPALAERLAAGNDAADALTALGWQGGTFRQFASDPPPGGTGRVDLSLYRFADAGAAADAVAFFANSRARGASASGQGDRDRRCPRRHRRPRGQRHGVHALPEPRLIPLRHHRRGARRQPASRRRADRHGAG